MHHSDPSTNILPNKFLILFYPVGIWPLAGSFFSFSIFFFLFYLLVICFFCSRVERVWCEALTWVNWNKWNKWNKWLSPLFWATTWKRTPPKPQPDYRLLRPTASLCGRRWNHETLLIAAITNEMLNYAHLLVLPTFSYFIWSRSSFFFFFFLQISFLVLIMGLLVVSVLAGIFSFFFWYFVGEFVTGHCWCFMKYQWLVRTFSFIVSCVFVSFAVSLK